MGQQLRKKLEDEMRATGKQLGVEFSRLELTSAAREIGLLTQIELNYPSQEVEEWVDVSYPDPANPLQMIQDRVRRVKRVMMTEAEAIAFHNKLAEERVIAQYANDPEGLKKFLGQLPSSKAVTRKAAAKKPK